MVVDSCSLLLLHTAPCSFRPVAQTWSPQFQNYFIVTVLLDCMQAQQFKHCTARWKIPIIQTWYCKPILTLSYAVWHSLMNIIWWMSLSLQVCSKYCACVCSVFFFFFFFWWWFRHCIMSRQHEKSIWGTDLHRQSLVATLRQNLQIKLSVSSGPSILTQDQPVLALTP